jgi:hypothetical protein
MNYSYTKTGGVESIAALIDGQLYQATDRHPNWERIEENCFDETLTASDFDMERQVADYLALSDDMEVKDGGLFLLGEPMHGVLADKILESVRNGDNAQPLVQFAEKLRSNPSRNSRDQLFNWLEKAGLELTPDGNVIGYKSVHSVPDLGEYHSVSRGIAWVNGERKLGQIYQKIGDVVTMPRSEVTDNPAESCSYGLHVGTREHAEAFLGDTVLLVYVNPKDVVSVPNADATKMRVCQYKVGAVLVPEPVEEEPSVDVAEWYTFVYSSLLKQGTWTPDKWGVFGELKLTFNNGKSYYYRDVPGTTWADLVKDDKNGNATYNFNNCIKGCYPLI